MKRLSKLLFTMTFAVATLVIAQTPAAAPKAKTTESKASKKAEVTPAPSAQEVADAKAKGLVWVNLGTGVYHKDGEFFGKTKRGKFMTEDDAKKAGYRAAMSGGGKKSATAKPKDDTKKK